MKKLSDLTTAEFADRDLLRNGMKELKEKNEKELIKELHDKEEALRTFRFGVAGSKVRNVKEGRAIRKDIARIKTELSMRKK